MGWFDEQIRQRKLSDQEIMEDSLFRMASVVLGRQRAGVLSDDRIVTKAAIDDILKLRQGTGRAARVLPASPRPDVPQRQARAGLV